jgi:hypothetical protein
MGPKPVGEAQEHIAQRIDAKARAIAEGRGRWEAVEILAEMRLAVPDEGNAADDWFAERYAAWRSEHPLEFST